jgi:hypothetical protein
MDKQTQNTRGARRKNTNLDGKSKCKEEHNEIQWPSRLSFARSFARKRPGPTPSLVGHKEETESQAESVVELEHDMRRRQERITGELRIRINSM